VQLFGIHIVPLNVFNFMQLIRFLSVIIAFQKNPVQNCIQLKFHHYSYFPTHH